MRDEDKTKAQLIQEIIELRHKIALRGEAAEHKRAVDIGKKERREKRSSDLVRINEQLKSEIEERKRIEQALRESEELYRNLYETPLIGLWRTRIEDGKFIRSNRANAEIIGINDPDELVRNYTASEFYSPQRRAELIELLKKDKIVSNFEANLTLKDGSVKNISISAKIFPEQGYIEGAIVDITTLKRAEEALRESENKFSVAFKFSPVMCAITSLENGTYLDVNDKFTELSGFSRNELLGKTSIEVGWLRAADRLKLIDILQRQGKVSGIEITSYARDGKAFECSYHCELVTIGGIKRILTVVQDITERKRAEAEKEKLLTQLIQAQKMESVGRLAGGVAHDFNNTLTAILGHSELAMMRCSSSEPIYENLKVIEKSALRSTDLVRQLLAFARQQTVEPKVLDVNETVEGMLKILPRLIGEDIDLVWAPGTDLWHVKIDPSQIDQILANLCVNARDAIAGVGRITIETRNANFDEVYCAAHPEVTSREYVMLSVSDDGCGMAKEILDHLFEPFFTTKAQGTGTGLGLATVHGIVKQNEGFINVYTVPGGGTTFKIHLPRCAGEALEHISARTIKTPKGKGETLLLVEDDTEILTLSKSILTELGYRVLTAETPEEALQKAKTYVAEIQLLITDVVMPGMNGRELAKLINSIKPELKCLFTSGYTANIIAHRGIINKGMHFLQKPFSMKDIGFKVREVLENE
jgi:two-component system, cell cycle sensor histidine kinase and response regulator CckA